VTVDPAIVQFGDPDENVTGLPDPPPVADTVYVVPSTALVGGVEVKVMV
jgi:ABC-type uncharacterized transport system substrate-binding protein